MSWVFDSCHNQLRPGDVVIAPFRGQPDCRFKVIAETGTGMFIIQRPDDSMSPMRPSTILANGRIER